MWQGLLNENRSDSTFSIELYECALKDLRSRMPNASHYLSVTLRRTWNGYSHTKFAEYLIRQ